MCHKIEDIIIFLPYVYLFPFTSILSPTLFRPEDSLVREILSLLDIS